MTIYVTIHIVNTQSREAWVTKGCKDYGLPSRSKAESTSVLRQPCPHNTPFTPENTLNPELALPGLGFSTYGVSSGCYNAAVP